MFANAGVSTGKLPIAFIGSAEAAAATVTIPAHVAGDLIIIHTVCNGGLTIPSLPAGYTYAASVSH